MKRRRFLAGSAAAGGWRLATREGAPSTPAPAHSAPPLNAPAKGPIPVAFVISNGATVIDFCGPWEVFQDVHVPTRGTTMDEMMPFQLFTVADSADPVRVTGGMQIVPDFTTANTPQPRVIVVPAMRPSDALLEWLRKASAGADLTMSVCTGAFVLARAGLLKGLAATTHHDFFDRYFGREVAKSTAAYMEYQGTRWRA